MMHEDVPHEIWTEIFTHLPRSTLMQVHLTQRSFRAITLPFLFREFNLLPRRRNVQIDEYLNIASERMQFWTSSTIAPLVHHCGVENLQNLQWYSVSLTNVLAEFFDSIQHFTNMRRLSMGYIEYNLSFLRTVRLLPNLTHLELRACGLNHDGVVDLATLPPLEISEFIYGGGSQSNPQHWFPFLRRTKLRNFSTSYDKWMFAQIIFGDPFPCVTRLKLTMKNGSTLFSNLRVLTKFPATEVLTIGYSEMGATLNSSEEHRVLLSNALASLKEYHGPDDPLDVLLPIAYLRRLILPHIGKPSPHLAKLRAFNAPNHITFLDIHFSDFDHEALRDLCGFFPHLTDLRIKVTIPHLTEDDEEEYYFGEDPSWEIYQFFRDLVDELPFPASIQKIAIHWEYEDDDTHMEDGPLGLSSVKDALISKYPDMKAIWVDGSPRFLYYWALGEDGLECYGNNDNDAYWDAVHDFRMELKMFWDKI
ncbi:hypothetical protein K438DRAFT_702406 [Mycena galopus ATCC 62051]|nr:hypothetical protein K438DRAFT_702406 [Mycena galopus ATCC 62051]